MRTLLLSTGFLIAAGLLGQACSAESITPPPVPPDAGLPDQKVANTKDPKTCDHCSRVLKPFERIGIICKDNKGTTEALKSGSSQELITGVINCVCTGKECADKCAQGCAAGSISNECFSCAFTACGSQMSACQSDIQPEGT